MKNLSLLNVEMTIIALLFAHYSGYLLGRKGKIWKFDDKKVAYTVIVIGLAIMFITALVINITK